MMNDYDLRNIELAGEKAKQLCRNLGFDDPSKYPIEDLALVQGLTVRESNLAGSEARLFHNPSLKLRFISI